MSTPRTKTKPASPPAQDVELAPVTNETVPTTPSSTNFQTIVLKPCQPSTSRGNVRRNSIVALGSAFKQQKLHAWKPVINSSSACPTLLILALLCIPVGIGILNFSHDIQEVRVPYTDCLSNQAGNEPCSKLMGNNGPDPTKICYCVVNFTVKEEFSGQVYMYYELTNFFQNHRRLLRSRDDRQFFGGVGEPSKECQPFDKVKGTGQIYWPCGAHARSMFQDTIRLFGEDGEIELDRKGTAWPNDKLNKFKNPDGWNSKEFKATHAKPDLWIVSPWELDLSSEEDNGLDNDEFIAWMRPAAFPTFRKLYRVIPEGHEMYKGDYHLEIKYTFPVTQFQGTKSIIFSTISILGGKNEFLGFCFIVVGVISLCFGLLFLGVKLMERRMRRLRVGIGELTDQTTTLNL